MVDPSHIDSVETADVIFGTREIDAGLSIGLILLNRPAQLNAISTEMFIAMNRQLDSWEHDDHIVGLGIAGVGDRAFCAGGDVVALREALLDSRDVDADRCFDEEYFLDSRLHQWTKPLIVLAHGVCMGGGVGLLMAGSHRVVTSDTQIAMPEVNIGFYPDVGSGGFLNQLPSGVGRTMAVTGMKVDSSDATWLGLATADIGDVDRSTIWDQVADLAWTTDETQNHVVVDDFFEQLTAEAAREGMSSQVEQHAEQFSQLAAAKDVSEFGVLLTTLASDYEFFAPSAATFARVSPSSLVLTDRYFELCRGRATIEVLKTDEILSKRYIREPDFVEGVRSVLVAKETPPCWRFGTVNEVDDETIDQLLLGL